MVNLDRLGWAAGRSLRCHGVRVGVRVSDGDTLRAFESDVRLCVAEHARRSPAEVLATLTRIARGSLVLRGTRAEAEEAGRRLLEEAGPPVARS
jgi:hypothetical protein